MKAKAKMQLGIGASPLGWNSIPSWFMMVAGDHILAVLAKYLRYLPASLTVPL
jgi:hypothetical protein